MARLSPVKAKSTITAGELNALFKNAPHLSEEEIKEFEQNVNELRELKDTEVLNKFNGARSKGKY